LDWTVKLKTIKLLLKGQEKKNQKYKDQIESINTWQIRIEGLNWKKEISFHKRIKDKN
jgi:hypothetical protein